jgi:hypothetical protein
LEEETREGRDCTESRENAGTHEWAVVRGVPDPSPLEIPVD